jgi:hypothetical protein
MNEYEILNWLHDHGVEFVVKVPDRRGVLRVKASAYDLIEFAADKERFYAKCHLVTKQTYLSWTSDDFSVRCSHAEHGIACENLVLGGRLVTARAYVRMQGKKCSQHRENKDA